MSVTRDRAMRAWLRNKGWREPSAHRDETDAFLAGWDACAAAILANVEEKVRRAEQKEPPDTEVIADWMAASITVMRREVRNDG